jgi:hypothetical protein
MPDAVETSVRERLEGFAASLAEYGVLESFEINQNDGVKLVARGTSDGQSVVVEMTGTTEVYLLTLGDIYRTQEIAYDADGKLQALDDLLAVARRYLEKQYCEEIRKRNGDIVSRTIHFVGDDAPASISQSLGWQSKLKALLGSRKTVVPPA